MGVFSKCIVCFIAVIVAGIVATVLLTVLSKKLGLEKEKDRGLKIISDKINRTLTKNLRRKRSTVEIPLGMGPQTETVVTTCQVDVILIECDSDYGKGSYIYTTIYANRPNRPLELGVENCKIIGRTNGPGYFSIDRGKRTSTMGLPVIVSDKNCATWDVLESNMEPVCNMMSNWGGSGTFCRAFLKVKGNLNYINLNSRMHYNDSRRDFSAYTNGTNLNSLVKKLFDERVSRKRRSADDKRFFRNYEGPACYGNLIERGLDDDVTVNATTDSATHSERAMRQVCWDYIRGTVNAEFVKRVLNDSDLMMVHEGTCNCFEAVVSRLGSAIILGGILWTRYNTINEFISADNVTNRYFQRLMAEAVKKLDAKDANFDVRIASIENILKFMRDEKKQKENRERLMRLNILLLPKDQRKYIEYLQTGEEYSYGRRVNALKSKMFNADFLVNFLNTERALLEKLKIIDSIKIDILYLKLAQIDYREEVRHRETLEEFEEIIIKFNLQDKLRDSLEEIMTRKYKNLELNGTNTNGLLKELAIKIVSEDFKREVLKSKTFLNTVQLSMFISLMLIYLSTFVFLIKTLFCGGDKKPRHSVAYSKGSGAHVIRNNKLLM